MVRATSGLDLLLSGGKLVVGTMDWEVLFCAADCDCLVIDGLDWVVTCLLVDDLGLLGVLTFVDLDWEVLTFVDLDWEVLTFADLAYVAAVAAVAVAAAANMCQC